MIITVGAAIIILYVFGKAGQLHTEFKDNIKTAATHSRRKKRGIIRKEKVFYQSCYPVRVAFGISNFVERNTPLKFVDFSIIRFVDSLLLGKRK